MPALTRVTKLDYTDGHPLGLTWALRGPAGAVALQVHLGSIGEMPGAKGQWAERSVYAGRHAYVRLGADDGRRDGECDLLEGTDTCWFNARDTWGRKLWERVVAGGDREDLIWRELEGYYREEFHP